MTPAINTVNDQAAKPTRNSYASYLIKVPFFYCKPRDCLGYYIAMINTYHCLLCQLFVYFHLPEYYCCNTRSGEVILLRIPSRKRYPDSLLHGFQRLRSRWRGLSVAQLVCLPHKPTTRQTSHANDFVNLKAYRRETSARMIASMKPPYLSYNFFTQTAITVNPLFSPPLK